MQKSPDAFRTISEVATDLDIPQHVLRFWETRFPSIRPLKRGGGRRYYRPDDVDLLKGIRQLLYGQGYTIKGVQRILKEDGLRFVQAVGRGEQAVAAAPHAPETADEADGPEVSAYPGEVEAQGFYAVEDSSDLDPRRGQPFAHTPSRPSGPALSPDDIARLRQTLDELHECERILGSLHAPD